MAKLSDTSPDARRVLCEIYRKMSPGDKWLRLGQMYRDARALHAAGVRLRDPAATGRDIQEAWVKSNLGLPVPPDLGEYVVDQQSLHDLREIMAVFTKLDIPYALGGSMASSIHGHDRHTRDGDVTVEPFPGKESQLIVGFGSNFYVSDSAVREAVRNRTSFNIINTKTAFKVDVFVRKDLAFEKQAMARRISVSLPDSPEQPIIVLTPEDVILFKLRWYRLGGEISEQQWEDILGVIRTQGAKLDQNYLDQWAKDLQVADLLARVRKEAAV